MAMARVASVSASAVRIVVSVGPFDILATVLAKAKAGYIEGELLVMHSCW